MEKYLSEMATALATDGKIKNSQDVWAFAEIASILSQRFREFNELVVEAFRGIVEPPPVYQGTNISAEQKEKEESARITRQKFGLRVLMEFYFVGLLSESNPRHKDLLPAHLVQVMVRLLDITRVN